MIVLFGASGDIHKKKVYPGLYELYNTNYKMKVIGIGRTKLDNNNYRNLIQNSIQKSNLSSFINRSENKLETLIGERGIKISGGQKQRIGIARTIYRKSRIIIFDEATNSLDKDSEKDILETIYSLEDVTIIFISHDKKVFYKCDKVYKINNGIIKLIE